MRIRKKENGSWLERWYTRSVLNVAVAEGFFGESYKSGDKYSSYEGRLIRLKQTVKNIDPLSWVFIGLGAVVFAGVIWITSALFVESEAFPAGEKFYESNLNLTVNVPHGWEIATPDEENVKETVREATKGLLFDTRAHTLKEEVVAAALVLQPTDLNAKNNFAKFLTIAFRGSNTEHTYLDDEIKLMDQFKSLLTTTGHTDVKVLDVEEDTNFNSGGVIIRGTAILQEQKIKYIQYFEPAGANLLVVTYGTTKGFNEGIKDIGQMLNSLQYHDGDVFVPDSYKNEIATKEQKEWEEEKKAQQEAQLAGTVENSVAPSTSTSEAGTTSEAGSSTGGWTEVKPSSDTPSTDAKTPTGSITPPKTDTSTQPKTEAPTLAPAGW